MYQAFGAGLGSQHPHLAQSCHYISAGSCQALGTPVHSPHNLPLQHACMPCTQTPCTDVHHNKASVQHRFTGQGKSNAFLGLKQPFALELAMLNTWQLSGMLGAITSKKQDTVPGPEFGMHVHLTGPVDSLWQARALPESIPARSQRSTPFLSGFSSSDADSSDAVRHRDKCCSHCLHSQTLTACQAIIRLCGCKQALHRLS